MITRDTTIWLTADLVFACWWLASVVRVRHGVANLTTSYRWIWGIGWVLLAVHIALAFVFVHGSLAEAYRQTEIDSGFGEGIFVNFAVLLIWGVDSAWSFWDYRQYKRQSRWWAGIIQGFILFIMFNAVVIFASGAIRWIGIVGFGWLTWEYRKAPPTSPSVQSAGEGR